MQTLINSRTIKPQIESNVGGILPLLFRQILTKRMMIKGFIVFNHYDQRDESIIELSKWIKEGKIKYKEDFVEGLEMHQMLLLVY